MDDNWRKYRRICKDGLYGFMDRKRREIIPCKWENVCNFREGMAAVKRDGRWGFINADGAEVIPYIYDSETPGDPGSWDRYYFQNGAAKVRRNGKWGLVDPVGTEVVPCQWSSMKRENDGVVIVEDALHDDGAVHCGVIDPTGTVLIPCAWRRELRYLGEGLFCERPLQQEYYSLLDRNGMPAGTTFAEIGCFSEGMACCRIGNQYGFLNAKGEIAIPCVWKMAHGFHDGVARVTQDGNQWGLIDKTGTLISPCQWSEMRAFHDGMAAVCRDGKWGYVNTNGQLVIPCEWDWAYDFFSGDHTALVCRIKGCCDTPPFDGLADFDCEQTGKLCVGILKCDQFETFRVTKTGQRLPG